jgi:hypothetical protein
MYIFILSFLVLSCASSGPVTGLRSPTINLFRFAVSKVTSMFKQAVGG